MFFGSPFYHWLSVHCNRFLLLFAQVLILNCLSPGSLSMMTILHVSSGELVPLWRDVYNGCID